MGLGEEEAECFISHLADLVACLNDHAESIRQDDPPSNR